MPSPINIELHRSTVTQGDLCMGAKYIRMDYKDYILSNGGRPPKGQNRRYQEKSVQEDSIDYAPTKLNRLQSGKVMWTHVEIVTSTGTYFRKSMSLKKIEPKYGNTLLRATYVKIVEGKKVTQGRPHKF